MTEKWGLAAFASTAILLSTALCSAQTPAVCNVQYDVRTGPLVGCWNDYDQDHSFELVESLYDRANETEYRNAAGRCRRRDSIHRGYCDFTGLEVTIDRYMLAVARLRTAYVDRCRSSGADMSTLRAAFSAGHVDVAADPVAATAALACPPSRRSHPVATTTPEPTAWRLSAVRRSYLTRRMVGSLATSEAAFVESMRPESGSFEEQEVCGSRTGDISPTLSAAISMVAAQRASSSRSTGAFTAHDALMLLQNPFIDDMHCVPGRTRHGGPVCYDREDLASMYQFALLYMSGDPVPVLTAATVRATCRELHSTGDAARAAIPARVSESARRTARAGRLYSAMLSRLDDDAGASASSGFLALSEGVPLRGYSADGASTGPVLTSAASAAVSGCSSYGAPVGMVTTGSTGHDWVARYRQSVSDFRDAWASCMREELGSAPADGGGASGTPPATGGGAAETTR